MKAKNQKSKADLGPEKAEQTDVIKVRKITIIRYVTMF